jgi:hypothetical protein
MVTLSIPAEPDINSTAPLVSVPSSINEVGQKSGCGIHRRHVIIALGAGVALNPLTQPAGGLQELVLNAARGSTELNLLLGVTCVPLASLSHLTEPRGQPARLGRSVHVLDGSPALLLQRRHLRPPVRLENRRTRSVHRHQYLRHSDDGNKPMLASDHCSRIVPATAIRLRMALDGTLKTAIRRRAGHVRGEGGSADG